MARQGWKTSAIREDELEKDLAWLKLHDPKLPESASFIDAYRSWKKLAKKSVEREAGSDLVPGSATITGERQSPLVIEPVSPTAKATTGLVEESLGHVANEATSGPAPKSPDLRSRDLNYEKQMEILREQNRLATQQYNIEKKKSSREFWHAVRLGRADAPTRSQQQTSAKLPFRRVYCPLHQGYHDTWPCQEVKQMCLEQNAPIPAPQYEIAQSG